MLVPNVLIVSLQNFSACLNFCMLVLNSCVGQLLAKLFLAVIKVADSATEIFGALLSDGRLKVLSRITKGRHPIGWRKIDSGRQTLCLRVFRFARLRSFHYLGLVRYQGFSVLTL